jgi:glycerol-3-phosphate acyltransferase PlsY
MKKFSGGNGMETEMGFIFGLMAMCLFFLGTALMMRIVRRTRRVVFMMSIKDLACSVLIFSLAVICSFAAGLNFGGRNFENTLTQEVAEKAPDKSDNATFLTAKATLPDGESPN